MIPYGRQSIDQADIDAVVAVLQSDYLTQGPAVPDFEDAFARRVQAPCAVACNSATSALHLAYRALGLGPGDSVWTSPNTFVATANAALYCGADVGFVDIDPRTYNLSVEALAARLELAAEQDRLPTLVAPVHFAGQPCDLAGIARLARQYGFAVVEDASHAVGARYRDQPVGSCEYSDITVFSFHPVKIMTTAEGGLATTGDARLAERMRRLRSHGVTREVTELEQPSPGGWYYEQQALGYNYRMTDLQAALGLSQLQRLDVFLDARRRLAARYDERLAGLPIIRPYQSPGSESSLHLYPIRLRHPEQRTPVYEAMRAAGVGVNVHYIPVHTQPYYRRQGFGWGDFPKAEAYYQAAISLPLHPCMDDSQQDYCMSTLSEALRVTS